MVDIYVYTVYRQHESANHAKNHSKTQNRNTRYTVSNVTLAVAVPSEVSSERKSIEATCFGFLNHVLNKSAVLPHIELKYLGTRMPAQEDVRELDIVAEENELQYQYILRCN